MSIDPYTLENHSTADLYGGREGPFQTAEGSSFPNSIFPNLNCIFQCARMHTHAWQGRKCTRHVRADNYYHFDVSGSLSVMMHS
jgi:hypothetical protein